MTDIQPTYLGTTIYHWQVWSDLVNLENEPDTFTGTHEQACAYFCNLHSAFIAAGYQFEDYSDEQHIYPPDLDDDDDWEPVAGMTCEGTPDE